MPKKDRQTIQQTLRSKNLNGLGTLMITVLANSGSPTAVTGANTYVVQEVIQQEHRVSVRHVAFQTEQVQYHGPQPYWVFSYFLFSIMSSLHLLIF